VHPAFAEGAQIAHVSIVIFCPLENKARTSSICGYDFQLWKIASQVTFVRRRQLIGLP
jgi:hypothetical protein